ncbi:hypothetical protein L484_003038 [Morus notabilis]|uniref:C2 domain-containing protein n=1 Tax=Morus notabilis TaxID=981085 RepID=W9R331_9ROSA|nr:protein SRC2 [Morus notabilis]EXB66282.1 hypothetical protein L484_003038 [Morus notabilis]
MASRDEVEVKLSSAKDLKNVNWRHGPVRPYAVVWVDPNIKCSTRVDESGDTNPNWDETLTIPLPTPIDDSTTLYIDIVHAGSEPDTKRLIGSARLKLREVVDDVGYGERATRTLQMKRPSGRPQGKVEVKVSVREPYYRPPDPYSAPPYGVPPPAYGGAPYASVSPPPPRDPYYAASAPPPPSRDPYYAAAAPPSGYPYNPYSAPPQPYGQPGYGQGGYGEPVYGRAEEKKSKFGGMGTGLAVGAVAGALGGLALVEGVDFVEDKIADDVAERVEDDIGYDGDDF